MSMHGSTLAGEEEVAKAIQITVQDQAGQSLEFKMRLNKPFKKLFAAWTERFQLDPNAVRFMADEKRLQPSMTPADVEMENGDVIDVYQEQMGGGDEGGDEKKVEQLNLKVKDSNGNEVFFKMKKTATLKKLMNAFCDRQGVDPGTMVFLYDGDRVQPEHTPEQLGMEDGDEIDAMIHQTGGRR